MPVLGIPLDDLFEYLGHSLPAEELEHELHRFGCSVEGWATVRRWRCPWCAALSESPLGTPPPPQCEGCGADFRASGKEPAAADQVQVLRMELLAVRPDLFDPPGLARALRGFLGRESGAPHYPLEAGDWTIEVDPELAGTRPRIAAATVHGLKLDEVRLRSLMKLQENVHWALGRDRKLASIGVYDLSTVRGPVLKYRAAGRHEVRFVPLGADPEDPAGALDPQQILDRHPKGRAFAWLLGDRPAVPLLEDAAGGVLSMPPIINSEATRVTACTTDVLIDVTGLADRQIERALNIVVTSLLESCPDARARTLRVRYGGEERVTPQLAPQRVTVRAAEAGRLIGVPWTAEELAALLRRMRHDAAAEGDEVQVEVPAWRSDILHPRDLVEDAAIAYGYDRLPEIHSTAATFGRPHPREELAIQARAALAGLGMMEVITLPLTSEEATFVRCGLPGAGTQVKIENPISTEQTMVRISVIPGLLETLAVNLGHPYPQRIFEVGIVAGLDEKGETGSRERLVAGVALAGDGCGYADIRSAAELLLAELGLTGVGRELSWRPLAARSFIPGRGAEILIAGRPSGMIGEVHPEVLAAHRLIHPVVLGEIDLNSPL